ncbi:Uncharacterised protein [Sphingobacterium daejeonense]|nr:Uncharacterised protein [Sphingobacterium daejeonense]
MGATFIPMHTYLVINNILIMTRTTESNNTIRVDKATHLEYELTFNIVSKTEGLESISVSGVKKWRICIFGSKELFAIEQYQC